MSAENQDPPADNTPASPAVVKKAASTVAKPKVVPKPPAKPAPENPPETPVAPRRPAPENAAGKTEANDSNPFSIFGWGD
jgi:hypothetical protein